MQDARWSQLQAILVDNGWVWRDDALYAPHETMWFQGNPENPDFAQFRDRVTMARDATGSSGATVDHAALHADLVSLIDALDAVLLN